jgi:hypothetical protein
VPDCEVLQAYTNRHLVVDHAVDDRGEKSKRDDFDKFQEGVPSLSSISPFSPGRAGGGGRSSGFHPCAGHPWTDGSDRVGGEVI